MQNQFASPAERLTFIQTDSFASFVTWFGVLCAGALGNIPSQDVMQRVFSARSVKVARIACFSAGTLYLTLGLVPILMGLAGHMLFEEGTATLPKLAALFLHPALAVVFVVTLMSTVLSTIDSALLAPATVLSRNVLAHIPRFSQIDPLRLTRVSLAIVAACATGLAYWGESASMLSGTLVWLLHAILGWESFFNLSELLPVGLNCIALSFVAYWVFRTPTS